MAAHMVCAIDYFCGTRPVTSTFLAGSIGTSPVMVRTIMGMLKQAGIINSSKGKTGITLARPLEQITLLDLWRAVDQSDADSLFHFHESPCPQCPVGGNIHAALDGRLEAAQQALESQLQRTTLADVEKDIRLLTAS
jgi:DNA-binding IscR family transcriptional regulator